MKSVELDWGGSEGGGQGEGVEGEGVEGEGVEGEGGLSPYFNSSLKRILAGKHLPCSSAIPIHITPVLLHP